MPMTEDEDRISRIIGSKSSRPIVGISRSKPGIAFTYWFADLCRFVKEPVVIAVNEMMPGFDAVSASWKPVVGKA